MIEYSNTSINIFSPSSYMKYLPGHTTAICTLGVGQPSKISKEDFIKIDKKAVIDFAKAVRMQVSCISNYLPQ